MRVFHHKLKVRLSRDCKNQFSYVVSSDPKLLG